MDPAGEALGVHPNSLRYANIRHRRYGLSTIIGHGVGDLQLAPLGYELVSPCLGSQFEGTGEPVEVVDQSLEGHCPRNEPVE